MSVVRRAEELDMGLEIYTSRRIVREARNSRVC
jgi:hypothetical protein